MNSSSQESTWFEIRAHVGQGVSRLGDRISRIGDTIDGSGAYTGDRELAWRDGVQFAHDTLGIPVRRKAI